MNDVTAHRQRQDFEDQQNELAGRETGRRARFGVGVSHAHEIKEKERKERAFRDALDRLLLDPEYRRLYENLGTRLSNAEREADTAIESVQRQLQQAQDDINAMEDKAARDPSRQAVFRYADGRVVNADGEELPPEIAEGIIWPDNAPSAEDYFAAKDRRDALADHLASWHTYRIDVLGDIRHRYDSDPASMDKDDLQHELDRIDLERPKDLSFTSAQAPTRRVETSLEAFPTIPMNGQ